jgi:alpha-beta hydrolase superfamily lysophospholipase
VSVSSGMATATLHRRATNVFSPSRARRHERAARRSSDGDIHRPPAARTRFVLSDHWFTTWDGTRLFYRAWRPAVPTGRILVLFHRGHEHSGRWDDVVDAIAPEGFSVFAWDARGNGRSEGPRDDAENFGCYARDAELFIRHLSEIERLPIEQMAVVGHSVGAAIVAAWIHDYAPRLRAAVLATPAFRIRLYLPFAIPALRMTQKLGIMRSVPSYVKARVLTHDPAERLRHERDDLITHSISTRVLIDLHDTSTRLIEDAAAIRVPTLVLLAGSDWVVKQSVQTRFFDRLGSPVKHLESLPGFFHDIYHEANASRPLQVTRDFIEAAFARRRYRNRSLTPTGAATRSTNTGRCAARLGRSLENGSSTRSLVCFCGRSDSSAREFGSAGRVDSTPAGHSTTSTAMSRVAPPYSAD